MSVWIYENPKYLDFSLAFLLFCCEARHDDKQPGEAETPHSIKHSKIDSIPAKISALEKLAALMACFQRKLFNFSNHSMTYRWIFKPGKRLLEFGLNYVTLFYGAYGDT